MPITSSYSPFGTVLYGRSWSSESYRYGFNGKEKEDDIASNDYDFGARIYDGRLGRWLSVDASFDNYPFNSVYSFVSNCVMVYIDPDGKDIFIYKKSGEGEPIKYEAGKPVPDGLDEYQTEAWNSLNTFINADKSNNILKIATTEEIELEIIYANEAAQFVPVGENTGYIEWDNRCGLLLSFLDKENLTQTVYPDDPNAVMSPSGTLKHEITHTINHFIKKIMKNRKNQEPSDSDMTDKEEEETIKETEVKDGKNRTNHYGVPIRTTSVDGTSGNILAKEVKRGKEKGLLKYGKWIVKVIKGKSKPKENDVQISDKTNEEKKD